jgi:predicted dehydrogenase
MMGVGIIGAGGITGCHLEAISRHRQTRALCLADIDLERAEHLAARYGISHVTADPNDILLNKGIHAVIIALPTFLHYEWLLRCAKAGKDILTEKPLCRTLAEGKRVLRACARHNVRLSVGYMRRFSPARLKVRSLVQSGALGRPVTWHISSSGPRSDFYRGPGNWMWDRDKGGGMVMDGSIHDFDFACWVLGEPRRMFAQSTRISDVVTAPTQAHALVTFVEGDRLAYNAAWQEGDFSSSEHAPRIIGPKGTIALESEFECTWYGADRKRRHFKWDPDRLRPTGMGPTWLFYRQLDSFVQKKADVSLATGEESLASLWMAEKIIDAGPDGRLFRYR